MKIFDAKFNRHKKFINRFRDPYQYHTMTFVRNKKVFYPKQKQEYKIGLHCNDSKNFKSPTNSLLWQHYKGDATLGMNNNALNKQYLLLIDCDVNDHIDPKWDYVKQVINQRYGANLYWERSSTGKTWHAYAIFDRQNLSLEQFVELINKEAQILSNMLPHLKHVEFCGLPNVYIKNKFGIITEIKNSLCMKWPRDDYRIDELENTSYITAERLVELQVETVKQKTNKVKTLKSGQEVDTKCITRQVVLGAKDFVKTLGFERVVVNNKAVEEIDIVYGLLILFVFNKNNMFHSVNLARILWSQLFPDRSFDYSRWKVIRDFLSQNKCLEWNNNEYTPPEAISSSGEVLKSKHMEYKLVASLEKHLETWDNTSARSNILPMLNGSYLLPKRKEQIYFCVLEEPTDRKFLCFG